MKLSECRSFSCSCSSPCQIRIHIRSWFAFLTSWMPFKACIRVHGNLQFDVSFASIPFFRRFTNEVMIKLGTHMSTVSHDKKDQLQRGPRIHGLEKQHLSLGQLIKAGIHFLGDLLLALPWKLCSPLLLERVPFQQDLGRLALGNFVWETCLGNLLRIVSWHTCSLQVRWEARRHSSLGDLLASIQFAQLRELGSTKVSKPTFCKMTQRLFHKLPSSPTFCKISQPNYTKMSKPSVCKISQLRDTKMCKPAFWHNVPRCVSLPFAQSSSSTVPGSVSLPFANQPAQRCQDVWDFLSQNQPAQEYHEVFRGSAFKTLT